MCPAVCLHPLLNCPGWLWGCEERCSLQGVSLYLGGNKGWQGRPDTSWSHFMYDCRDGCVQDGCEGVRRGVLPKMYLYLWMGIKDGRADQIPHGVILCVTDVMLVSLARYCGEFMTIFLWLNSCLFFFKLWLTYLCSFLDACWQEQQTVDCFI